jgi:hypothetical protein
LAALLLASHALFPFEVAGIVATGIPVLAMLWLLVCLGWSVCLPLLGRWLALAPDLARPKGSNRTAFG